MKHLRKSTDAFWRRWRSEKLNELREAHRYQQNKTATSAINPGDVVIVHDPDIPRGLCKLGRVQDILPGQVRGTLVEAVTNDKVITLSRPLQRLCPLEVPGASVEIEAAIADGVSVTPEKEPEEREEVKSSDVGGRNRLRRKAYQRAQDKLKVWVDALKHWWDVLLTITNWDSRIYVCLVIGTVILISFCVEQLHCPTGGVCALSLEFCYWVVM